MKSCKHAVVKNSSFEQLGGEPIHSSDTWCRIKMKGEQERMAIYHPLFEKGLEGSMITNTCPVSNGEKWSECPFYEAS